MTIGQQVISLFFLMTYAFPFVGNYILRDGIESIYKLYPVTFYSFSILVLTYAGYLALARSKLLARYSFGQHRSCLIWLTPLAGYYARHRILFGAVALFFGVWYYLAGFTAYRYSHAAISERGSFLLLVGILLNTAIGADQFYSMFVQSKEEIPVLGRRWTGNVLLALAMLLLVNGTGDAFLALFAAWYAFFPASFKKRVFVERGISPRQRAKNFASLLCVSFLIFGMAWICGERIKVSSSTEVYLPAAKPQKPDELRTFLGGLITLNITQAEARRKRLYALFFGPKGSKRGGEESEVLEVRPPPSVGGKRWWIRYREKLMDLIEKEGELIRNPKTFLCYFVQSLSVHYYSLLYVAEAPRAVLNYGEFSPIVFPLRTFVFRADHLTGGFLGVERPEVSSVALLNYRLLAKDPNNPREGSSPGLLGSFAYVFGFPLNVLFCCLYLVFVSQVIDAVLARKAGQSISIIGLCLALRYLQIFFSSPADFLIGIDNSVILVGILIAMGLVSRAKGEGEPIPS